MTRSMTAYGRAQSKQYLIEIHSVNRRGLDLSLQLPKELLFLDVLVRKWIRAHLFRGAITVRVSCDKKTPALDLAPLESIEPIHKHFSEIAKKLNINPPSLPFLCEQVAQKARDIDVEAIKSGVEQALEQLIAMKEIEGKALELDILKRLDATSEEITAMESCALSAPIKLKERLNQRLSALNVAAEEVAKEIVLFADKCDITEEFVRLRSHFQQFQTLLNNEGPIGRTLDFLTIEMSRELNTIASKSFQHEITSKVPLLKAEVEKIKEQVSNIE